MLKRPVAWPYSLKPTSADYKDELLATLTKKKKNTYVELRTTNNGQKIKINKGKAEIKY